MEVIKELARPRVKRIYQPLRGVGLPSAEVGVGGGKLSGSGRGTEISLSTIARREAEVDMQFLCCMYVYCVSMPWCNAEASCDHMVSVLDIRLV